MATGAVSYIEMMWYHCPVYQGIHRSIAPIWRWLCLTYAALGIITPVGRIHLGVWLPGLMWLVCAAGTWQDKCVSVRGSLSILAPALAAVSYGRDFVITAFDPAAPPLKCAVNLTHCML